MSALSHQALPLTARRRGSELPLCCRRAFSPEHVKAIRRIIDMKKPLDKAPLKSEHDAKALILHSLAVSTVKKMPTDFETFVSLPPRRPRQPLGPRSATELSDRSVAQSNEMFESQAVKRHFHDPPYHCKLKSFMACLSGTIRKVKAVAGLVGKTPVKTQDKTRGKTPGAAKLGAGATKQEKPRTKIIVVGRKTDCEAKVDEQEINVVKVRLRSLDDPEIVPELSRSEGARINELFEHFGKILHFDVK